MRNHPITRAERHRVRHGVLASDANYGRNGAFIFPNPVERKSDLVVIASDGAGWEHISVHVDGLDRCPTWEEMDYIARLFWRDDEVPVQMHVPPGMNKVNLHKYTLHLWLQTGVATVLPPAWMVGPPEAASTGVESS